MTTNKCKICEQGEVSILLDGIYYKHCNYCGSEFADQGVLDINKPTTKPTTKQCPNCNDTMLSLHSTDEKICASCGTVINWPLDDGQKKVFDDKKSD